MFFFCSFFGLVSFVHPPPQPNAVTLGTSLPPKALVRAAAVLEENSASLANGDRCDLSENLQPNALCLFFFLFLPQVSVDYTEKMVSISNYPLSAALTCAKITTAFEEVWGVV